jgi:hypothetical protein
VERRTEGGVAIAASIFVLFSAMWEPLVAAIATAGGLLLIGVYEFVQTRDERRLWGQR